MRLLRLFIEAKRHPTFQKSVANQEEIPEVTEDSSAKETIQKETEEPRTGVEVIAPVIRGGKSFFTMRDLRNGNLVKNVTQASARRLWHYGIMRYNEIVPNIESAEIQWHENFGLLRQYNQGKNPLFDFILKTENGYRFFFGVTLDGIHGPWKSFVKDDELNG